MPNKKRNNNALRRAWQEIGERSDAQIGKTAPKPAPVTPVTKPTKDKRKRNK